MRHTLLALATTSLILASAPLAHDDEGAGPIGSFKPIATFNVPGATSAEIVSATPDGKWLVYSDAIGHKFGLVSIADPASPQQVAAVSVAGDPTSVAVLPNGTHAVGCVQPGRLLLIDLATFSVVGERAIGVGPDSVAVTTIDGQVVAVVAIENEGIAAKGYVEVIRLNLASFSTSPGATVEFADPAELTSAGLMAVDDPQPEFVSIFGTRVAVTLQENNGIAVIDIGDPAAPELEALFPAGVVEGRPADLADDDRISFSSTYPADVLAAVPTAGTRLPDAIAWSMDGQTLFTADEGEEAYEGGRGWSARTARGAFLFDDGGDLEATAVARGHYPDGRSDAKGIEAEGVLVAEFGRREFMFVSSERGAFVAVYRLDRQNRPKFLQLLPTGQAPEGLLAIPSRNLFVTANEGDDEDGTISIFKGVPGRWQPSPAQPTIESKGVAAPWGALSGLAASLSNPQVLFAVPDNALPSSIFQIHTGGPEARIHERVSITRLGIQALYDLEGIAVDTSIKRPRRNAGFWLASEGNARTTHNLLIQVDAQGRVLREVTLPADVDAPGGRIVSNGFEGVTVSTDGRYLLVSVQRPFVGDQLVGGRAYTRIARYDLELERWDAFFYPLEISPGTIGLSEITVVGRSMSGGDIYAVIERDNRLAGRAILKRIYTFVIEDLEPVDIATPVTATTLPGATVAKTLLRDVLPLFTPYEKVEGLALAGGHDLWVVLDNDGGEFESRLVRLPFGTEP